MQRVKELPTCRWYMDQTLANGWSRNVLALQIDAEVHARHAKAVSNFTATLPACFASFQRGDGRVREALNGKSSG